MMYYYGNSMTLGLPHVTGTILYNIRTFNLPSPILTVRCWLPTFSDSINYVSFYLWQ